jgi:hypothetical protein
MKDPVGHCDAVEDSIDPVVLKRQRSTMLLLLLFFLIP